MLKPPPRHYHRTSLTWVDTEDDDTLFTLLDPWSQFSSPEKSLHRRPFPCTELTLPPPPFRFFVTLDRGGGERDTLDWMTFVSLLIKTRPNL